jgi:hypothetical protein
MSYWIGAAIFWGIIGFFTIGRLTGWIKDGDYYPESAFRPSDLIFRNGEMDPGLVVVLIFVFLWLLAVVGVLG